MDALWYKRLCTETEHLRSEFSEAVRGLNALWSLGVISETEYSNLFKRLNTEHDSQFDYWREATKLD